MPESPRSRARELVLQALYAREQAGVEPDEDFSNIVDGDPPSPRTLTYARELYALVCRQMDWADHHIAELAEHWKIERMAAIDRHILRIALVELENRVDIPVKVVLNEAIELAKKYSTIQSSAFVNGILDRYVKTTTQG